MKSADIRAKFLAFFQQQGHTIVPSSSLIPSNDPTLLFVNAGMVQFKDVFLGKETRDYVRAVSAQRCVRAGGKHNDLENVGYTARHHTFFEMLGNFSFGDYFKREAINFAWDFLTKELKVPASRLWVTVYEKDDEAAAIWLDELKVDPARFSRCGDKDNFWAMGDTGPCGPCSEIFYDHGESVAGGPPGSPDQEGDRYVEIWNLVFMQYERDQAGTLHSLPKPSVDTGMGLERVAAVMQGVQSNYATDLFKGLIAAIVKQNNLHIDMLNPSLCVIADHIRSSVFLIVDGVRPSNEGRGYVLRRIIRRAVRHGAKLQLKSGFFSALVEPLVALMGDAYPELKNASSIAQTVLQQEENQFSRTVEAGLRELDQAIATLSGKVIPGPIAFVLYDTYGFPIDLLADIARERGLTVDTTGFEAEMARQRAQSQAHSHFAMNESLKIDPSVKSEFTGYATTEEPSAKIIALFSEVGEPLSTLEQGQQGMIILDKTPFYAESGGQVGDTGVLKQEVPNPLSFFGDRARSDIIEFIVQDTQSSTKAILHKGIAQSGQFKIGQIVSAQVDAHKRQCTALNHSATHLLHAALRTIVGPHVVQKGSLVAPDRLRFDFAHFSPLSYEQIRDIEVMVNTQIRANTLVQMDEMEIQQALDCGAMALFGEKYGDKVRVLQMGVSSFSVELCGGTHVERTGDIGLFKIISDSGIASGVRRIEAVTGEAALNWMMNNELQILNLADKLKANREQINEKVDQLILRLKDLERQAENAQAKMAAQAGQDLLDKVIDVEGIAVIAAEIPGADPKALRHAVDVLKGKLKSAAICLASVQEDRVNLVAAITSDFTDKLHAGQLINAVAEQLGGKGGGRADLAQAGAKKTEKLNVALKSVPEWVRQKLS